MGRGIPRGALKPKHFEAPVVLLNSIWNYKESELVMLQYIYMSARAADLICSHDHCERSSTIGTLSKWQKLGEHTLLTFL